MHQIMVRIVPGSLIPTAVYHPPGAPLNNSLFLTYFSTVPAIPYTRETGYFTVMAIDEAAVS